MNHKYLGFIRSWRLSNLKDARRLRNWGLFMRTSDMLHQNEKVFLKSETRTNDHTTTTTIFPRILLKKKCVLWSNEGWNWVIYEDTSLNLHQEKPTSKYAFSQKSIKKCFMMYFHKWLRMTTSKWRAQNGSKLLTGHTQLSHFKFLQEDAQLWTHLQWLYLWGV